MVRPAQTAQTAAGEAAVITARHQVATEEMEGTVQNGIPPMVPVVAVVAEDMGTPQEMVASMEAVEPEG